jgi:hypothetical protein
MKSMAMIADVHNKGIKEMAGEMINITFFHLIKSCGILPAQRNTACAVP